MPVFKQAYFIINDSLTANLRILDTFAIQNKYIMDLHLKPNELAPVLILGLFTIGFLFYFFLSHSKSLHRRFVIKYGENDTLVYWILFQKIAGFIFLGLIPGIVAIMMLKTNLADYGVSLKNISESLLWILGFGLVIFFMNMFAAKNPESLKMYPQIRLKEWTLNTAILSSLGWILYLVGYEFMFRGLLLFTFVPIIGVWPAIILNVTFYVLVHVPKGLKESIGSIPLGIILCILTLKTGTIWIALFVHIALALTNQFFSLKYHPEINLVTNTGNR